MKNAYSRILFLTIPLLFIIISSICHAGEKPILIGASVSLEGKYIETSFMVQNGYKLWAEQVNKQGGLLGRPVKLILYNDKSRKKLAASLYEKLIVEDRVDLTLSPYGTPLTMVASEATEKHGYVMLASAAASEQIWERGYKYIFGVYALADRYFIGFQDLLARQGYESIGILFENTAFNISIAKGVRKWADRFNLKLVYDNGFDDADNELPIILKQVMGKNIDGLIFSGYSPQCYQFIDLMKKADYRPKSLSFTIAPIHPDFYKKAGPFAEGIFAPSQWEPDERIPFPGTKQFIKDFKEFTGKMPSYHAASAYSACQILEKAIIQAQAIDHEKIRNYVSSFDTITIMGRFKVDHTGRQVGHNPILIQWQNGKKEIVYPGKMSTSQPQFNSSGE
ncbi:MAG: amino acid ABC transporter substrate-binding protein [Desulfobacula sp.]|jgi:branched-chain amino acid transport system substrate-binding protein|nr:amino acid ABC transporter substrate-binding protein [Desulfobacula sp.]